MARRPKAPALPTYEEQANILSDEMLELRLAGDFHSPRTLAWDSAVENADLTLREERLERWSERYCEILVSSFDPSMFEPSN